jgi:hypothetical protein
MPAASDFGGASYSVTNFNFGLYDPNLTFTPALAAGAPVVVGTVEPAQTVPEPASLSLLAAGGLGFAGWRRIRRRGSRG